MPVQNDGAWFGPLSVAPASVTRRIQSVPAFKVLEARGLTPEKTLIYAPVPNEPTEPDIVVIGRMFAWDEKSPAIWIFSTIGLSLLEQSVQDGQLAFRHFELALATNNSEKEDPFPTRIATVLSQRDASIPGWDWDQVKHPPLLQWLASAGRSIASSMKARTQFAIGDTLTLGPGNSPWTRSMLSHSVLLPAPAHMLLLGLSPFGYSDHAPHTVNAHEWHSNPGTDRYEHGWYWLLPVSEQEHGKATKEGTWNVFADLVELVPGGANDDCAVAFDLLRRAPPQ
jgi:hypothetical protein